MEQIIIKNKRICEYYSSHPSINIETMNLILLDFIEHLSVDMTSLIQHTFESQILSEIKEIKQSVNTLNESFTINLNEHNKSFIETLKLIISVHGNEQYDKFSSVVQRSIDSYIDKITMILPKSNEENNKLIQDHITLIHKNIQTDILQFMANKNETNITDFIHSFDSKLVTMQQPLYSIIHSNQKQITDNMTSMHSQFNEFKVYSDKIYTEMGEYLSKYKNSAQYKGQMAELNIEQILNSICPVDEIVNVTGQTGTGDFILKRDGIEFILFENKCYSYNVDTREVTKFYNDVNHKKLHAIFMSQTGGIVSKQDYHIEINKDGCVLVFLTNVNFNPDKIKLGIKIIENLAPKLKQIIENNIKDGINIEKDTLDKINEQYISFIEKKGKLKESFKEQMRINNLLLDSIDMPDLSSLLSVHYGNTSIKKCDLCNFTCDSNAKLTSHRKTHDKTGIVVQGKYDGMTISELRKECETLGVDCKKYKYKNDIIQLLNSL